jgi:hypothetical protein
MSFRGNTVAAVGGGVAGLGVLPRGPNTEEGERMSNGTLLVSKAPTNKKKKKEWASAMARVQYAMWIDGGAKCAHCLKPYSSVDDFLARGPRAGNPKVFDEMFVDDACWAASKYASAAKP